jgi:type VI secretion system secreted protein Hcp
MADMFLALTNVLGESLDHDHKMEIEVHEWTWAMTNDAPYRLRESERSGHSDVKPLFIHKHVDKASTTLMTFCAEGRHIPEATLTCRKNDGDKKVEYLKIILTDVKVESLTWSGRNQEHVVPEVLELSFLKVKTQYKIQHRDGELSGLNEFDFTLPEQKSAPPKAGK